MSRIPNLWLAISPPHVVPPGSPDFDPLLTAMWWSLGLQDDVPPLEPIDVAFLTADAFATLLIPSLIRGPLTDDAGNALIRTALAVVGSIPEHRAAIESQFGKLPDFSQGPFALAQALWQPYWRRFDWLDGKYDEGRWAYDVRPDGAVYCLGKSPEWKGPTDPRRVRINERWKGFQEAYFKHLTNQENPVRELQKALRTKLPNGKRRIFSWSELGKAVAKIGGIADLGTPEGTDQAIGVILGEILGEEGYLRVGNDGKISWNYFKAIDTILDAERAKIRDAKNGHRPVPLDEERIAAPAPDSPDVNPQRDPAILVGKLSDFCSSDPRLQAAWNYLKCKDTLTLEEAARDAGITIKQLRLAIERVKERAKLLHQDDTDGTDIRSAAS